MRPVLDKFFPPLTHDCMRTIAKIVITRPGSSRRPKNERLFRFYLMRGDPVQHGRRFRD